VSPRARAVMGAGRALNQSASFCEGAALRRAAVSLSPQYTDRDSAAQSLGNYPLQLSHMTATKGRSSPKPILKGNTKLESLLHNIKHH
jgi:hypothetical protein